MEKIKINWNLWLNGLLFFIVLFFLYTLISNAGVITKNIGVFLQVLSPLFIGAGIAYFLNKPTTRIISLLKRAKSPFIHRQARKISILITYMILLLLCFFIVYYLVPIVIANLLEFIRLLPAIYQNISHWLNSNQFQELDNIFNIEDSLRYFVNNFTAQDATRYITSSIESLSTFTFSLASQVFRVVVGIIISIYLLLYKQSILQIISRIGRISTKQEHLKPSNITSDKPISFSISLSPHNSLMPVLSGFYQPYYSPYYTLLVSPIILLLLR